MLTCPHCGARISPLTVRVHLLLEGEGAMHRRLIAERTSTTPAQVSTALSWLHERGMARPIVRGVWQAAAGDEPLRLTGE